MSIPLASHFNQYVEYCTYTKVLSRATIKAYRDVFRQFSVLMPEITHAEQLTSEAIDSFFVRVHQRPRKVGNRTVVTGVRASTIRTYGSKLHSFFEWLVARDQMRSNPIVKSQLPKVGYVDKRALSRVEIEKLLSAITQHAPNRFQLKRDLAMVHVLLFAGVRRTELLSFKLSDIDLVRRIVTIQGKTSKSQTTRRVPITAATVMHLEDYIQERRLRRSKNEYLWISNRADTELTSHGLRRWVERLKRRSGVNFHVHRFRHTFACMLGRSNVSAIKIQKLMGHTDLRLTQTYMRSLGVEDVRDSVQHLSLDSLSEL